MAQRLHTVTVSKPHVRIVAGLSALIVLLAVGVVLAWPEARTALFQGGAIVPQQSPSVQEQPATTVGKPYGDKVKGVFTFRGNPTRTYYGTGPIPRTAPEILWRYPKSGGMCAVSSDADGPREWCGTGWTGQPAVFERDGRTWVVFGAYDTSIHFLDAATGERILPSFKTGDIIKGSVTIDPDGYPLVYSGSRDNYYRVIAIDGDRPRELWKLHAKAVSPTMWNDDWDASGLIVDDYLFEGGENSQFHIVKLNRGYDANGKVTVDPKLVFNAPAWDAELLRDIGDNNVSVESSPTLVGNVVYFATSGGLVQGWDISGLKEGKTPQRVFRFWTGDDTDGTIAADEAGMLYIGSEYERFTQASKRNGQMMKLDPRKPDSPLVWKVDDQNNRGGKGGIYGSAGIYKDLVIWGTDKGDVLGIDRQSGQVRWRVAMHRVHMSPVIIDGVMVVGDCDGELAAYDITDTKAEPKRLWSIKPGACIESTPAVWNGKLYFGTRAGALLAIGVR